MSDFRKDFCCITQQNIKMKHMKIKIVANFLHNGKRKEIIEEASHLIKDPPQKKDTARLSNMIKKLFEDGLNRTVVVKSKIKEDAFVASINIRPSPSV